MAVATGLDVAPAAAVTGDEAAAADVDLSVAVAVTVAVDAAVAADGAGDADAATAVSVDVAMAGGRQGTSWRAIGGTLWPEQKKL